MVFGNRGDTSATGVAFTRDPLFRPVLSVTKFSTLEEEFEIGNDTPYGLGAGVWSRNGTQERAFFTHKAMRPIFGKRKLLSVITYRCDAARTLFRLYGPVKKVSCHPVPCHLDSPIDGWTNQKGRNPKSQKCAALTFAPSSDGARPAWTFNRTQL
jgi:hypothetical protein